MKSKNTPRGKAGWKKQVRRLLASKDYRPEAKSGIARILSVPTEDRSDLNAALRELQDEGAIRTIRRGRYVLNQTREKDSSSPSPSPQQNDQRGGRSKGRDRSLHQTEGWTPGESKAQSKDRSKAQPKDRSKAQPRAQPKAHSGASSGAEGILRFRYNGTAFVVLEKDAIVGRGVRIPARVSVNLAKGTTGLGLQGDRVALDLTAKKLPRSWSDQPDGEHRVIDLRSPDELKLEGRVTRVLESHEHRIIGTVIKRGGVLSVKPDSPTYPDHLDLPVTDETREIKNRERVLVEIGHWTDPSHPPRARLLDRLGMPGEEGLAMREIVLANDIREDFTADVVREARAVPATIPGDEIRRREDWREKLVFTIDPVDARDFDDAISIRVLQDGGWELAVHIADVSHYVQPGSPMDKEARRRGNSTYLPHRVIPMLPEELSNGICSLVPHEDRLTRCVVMQFDKAGHRRKTRFVSAVIHSKCRLTYEEAMEYLKGKPAAQGDPVPAAVLETWKLASILRKRRFENGGLDMDFPEVRVRLDEAGKAIDLVVSHNDESHQLIEECMLIANEAVAEEVKNRGVPCVYRVHEDPAEERLLEFREVARAAGFKVGDLSHRKEAQKLLAAANGHPAEHAIKIGFLKSLKRADYRTDPYGHYGLAKNNYTHFTSPIRRYADLIVHRALFKTKGQPTMSVAEMSKAADHISKTERSSAMAEQDSQRLKQFEFYQNVLADDPNKKFPAHVIDCSGMGVFAEIDGWLTRGLIRHVDIPGHVHFDRAAHCFTGLPGGRRLRVGDAIEVTFKNVDPGSRRIDFRMVGAPDSRSGSRGGRGRGRGRGKSSSGRRGSGRSSSPTSSERSDQDSKRAATRPKRGGRGGQGGRGSGGNRRRRKSSDR